MERELPGWGTEHLPLLEGTKVPQPELGKEHWVWRQIKTTLVLSTLWEEEGKDRIKTLGLVVQPCG